MVTGHQMIEETESETEGDDKEWRECESKSVNQSYIEMFRSSGTAIQMSADEITRLEVATDARSESGVGLSLQVTACPVKRSLRGQSLAIIVTPNLLCAATAQVKLLLISTLSYFRIQLLCGSATYNSRLWALGSP